MSPTLPFHPAVSSWFRERYESPTSPQMRAWPELKRGRQVLVAAPTGSGKTLAAFLAAIDSLVEEGLRGELPAQTRVVYVSPLKALSRDIELNLREPLAGIRHQLEREGCAVPEITTGVRTGDTSASDRARMLKNPPHILVTTPESLYLLLTSERGRASLKDVRTIIVDEIHALVTSKRGAHLSLSLERLEGLVGAIPAEDSSESPSGIRRLQRIGLSATQNPPTEVARFLTGARPHQAAECVIIDEGHERRRDLQMWVPDAPLDAVMSAECWNEIYDELALLAQTHRTTLIFANTRKLTERLARFLAERLGKDAVTSHHGSLSPKLRQLAETKLKQGKLKALVATASLELGIDIGDVDLVCQIGSPGRIATLLQRVGRSGHSRFGIPKGRLFPLSRDDLVECAALLTCARRGTLDRISVSPNPLDILCQQMIAEVASCETTADHLFALVRRSACYATLNRAQFDAVLDMICDGFQTSRGRRGAFIHRDETTGRLRGRRGARLSALTGGGAIAESFDYDVVLEPTELRIGSLHEDFAIESSAGDVFQLGNASYQIERIEPGVVRVRDAAGALPNLPFWIGEAPTRTDEVSAEVSNLRARIDELEPNVSTDSEAAQRWQGVAQELAHEWQVPAAAALQIAEYLGETKRALGVMPGHDQLVVERFFDETGSMHLVIHSTRGTRQNRALALALRKRFCRSFNVELQAAAAEDAILLSLGPTHSFPLEDVWKFLHSRSAAQVLSQAVLDSPLFQTRFRHNATRALAILRYRGGKRKPPRFQRLEADDLLALCFPDQVACLENIAGERTIPDHPLVAQTMWDTLHEAMDLDGLTLLLQAIEDGRVRCVSRDVTRPSLLAHEILNARPYAFLDDAPLEERRSQAVRREQSRGPLSTVDLTTLSPEAIRAVLEEVRPDPRHPDELHDVLSVMLFATLGEISAWEVDAGTALLAPLQAAGRVWAHGTEAGSLLTTTARAQALRRALEDGDDDALTEFCRGRLEWSGPITAAELGALLKITPTRAELALGRLESEGFVLRGQFRKVSLSPESRQESKPPRPVSARVMRPEPSVEFCERRILARIHRRTLNQSRREIEPISPAQFVDFLCEFQGLSRHAKRHGIAGTRAVLEQLEGFRIPASAWEGEILPARVADYDPSYLDQLSLMGHVRWTTGGSGATRLTKATPVLLHASVEDRPVELGAGHDLPDDLSSNARRLAQTLQRRGASFFPELFRESGLLPSQAEEAVSELVARGVCTSDGYSGLRTLVTPAATRARTSKRRRSRGFAAPGRALPAPLGLEWAGRLSLLAVRDDGVRWAEDPDAIERVAWRLLRRWGVVFRRILDKEEGLPPWRELLRVLWRLEARGEIRGGRFVSLYAGEQFALPEVLPLLRRRRGEAQPGEKITISAADPLNLVGILTPGERTGRSRGDKLVIESGCFATESPDEPNAITISSAG